MNRSQVGADIYRQTLGDLQEHLHGKNLMGTEFVVTTLKDFAEAGSQIQGLPLYF